MNLWADATESFGPVLWGLVLGGIIGAVVFGVAGALICRQLERMDKISLYYGNKISSWCFTIGLVVGAGCGALMAWSG